MRPVVESAHRIVRDGSDHSRPADLEFPPDKGEDPGKVQIFTAGMTTPPARDGAALWAGEIDLMTDVATHFFSVCPNCSTALRIRRVYAGQPVQCRQCSRVFVATESAGSNGSVSTETPAPPGDSGSPAVERLLSSCPHCRATLSVRKAFIGQTVRCKQCDEAFVVTDPSAGPAAVPHEAMPDSVGGDRAAIEAERDRLRTELEQLSHENTRLQVDHGALRVDHERLIADNAALASERDRLADENRDLTALHDALQAEQERVAADRDCLAGERERLVADKDQLQVGHDRLLADLNQLKAEHDRLREDHERLKSQRDQLQAERDQLQAEHDQQRVERGRFEAAVVELSVTAETQRVESERLRASEAELLSERNALKAGREELEAEHDELRVRNNRLRAEYDQIHAHNEGLLAERDRLRAELETSESLRTELERSTVERRREWDAEMATARAEIDRLRGERAGALEEAEGHRVTLSRLRTEIDKAGRQDRAEIDLLRLELDELRAAIARGQNAPVSVPADPDRTHELGAALARVDVLQRELADSRRLEKEMRSLLAGIGIRFREV